MNHVLVLSFARLWKPVQKSDCVCFPLTHGSLTQCLAISRRSTRTAWQKQHPFAFGDWERYESCFILALCISYLVPNNKSPPNLTQLPYYIIAGSPGQDTMYAEIGTLSQVFSEVCHQIYSAILLLSRTTRDNNIMDISER